MLEKILELKESGKTNSEIGEELGITRQKVGALIKKHDYEESMKVDEDEFKPALYAKSSNVIKDPSMGGAIIMTSAEYHEYSEANGRYQGRAEGVKTALDPMELRVAISGIQSGDRSALDVRTHLMLKHGIGEKELRKVILKLTKEEEVSYAEVCKSLGLRG